MAWDARYPGYNGAAVATGKLDGVWFLEIDHPDVIKRIKEETGKDIPDTFRVRSRPGRGHFYWYQTPASLAMGNISQTYVKHGDWSVRVSNQYVVAPGSIHPDSKLPYTSLREEPIIPAPDWLIEWLLSQKTSGGVEKIVDTTAVIPKDARGLIPHGYIHGWMLNQAGKLRNMGLGAEEIEPALLKLVRENCAPPINEEKVKQMAHSVCTSFPPGQNTDLILSQTESPKPPVLTLEIDTSDTAARPVFPIWALDGTSIQTGLVGPAVAASSKHAEFIAMPAIQTMMNYMSGRVKVRGNGNHNIFVGLVSPYGQFFKSSSCVLAHDYFKYMGILSKYGKDLKMAEDKTIMMQAGSPEGFGLSMSKINGSHAVLFNDELGKFVSKAFVESSAFSSDLLSWYEAGDFGNNTTGSGGKNNFNFQSGSYTFSWLWATTDRGFNRHWPKLAGISSGLEDRMFFVVSPEKPKPTVPHIDPDFLEPSKCTRMLIDKALKQGVYEFENFEAYKERVAGMDPRSMGLIQKLALYFCVDLGADAIDGDHIDRAIALVEYRNQAAKFLAPIEADNHQGRLQKEILRELQQNRGKMKYRDLCRNLDYGRYGMDMWKRAYATMLPSGFDEGQIFEFSEEVTPGKRPAKMVGLIKFDE
jgi:hypothetical protein